MQRDRKERKPTSYNNNISSEEEEHSPKNEGYTDDDHIEVSVQTTQKTENPENIDLENKVLLSLKTSKRLLREISNGTTLPMLLNIDVAEMKSSTKAHIDLICVLDKSGSMQGQKIKLLIDSFSSIMEYLGDNDRMSIVPFNGSAKRLTPLLRMTAEGKTKTLNALKTVVASGGTDIADGVSHALEIIRQRKVANNVTSILILSDGLDGGAEKKVQQLLNSNQDKIKDTFTINTFGYGSDHDPKLMSGLAQLKDGSFYFIDKLDTVDEVFVDCLGGLISVVAQNMNITVKGNNNDSVLPGIKILKAFGTEGFWKSPEKDVFTTELLQIISGKKYSYVFEVEIPRLLEKDVPAKTFLVAAANIAFKDLSGKVYYKSAECDITFVDDDDNEQPDKEVLVEYYRVKTAEVTKAASDLSASRKFEDAKKVLLDFKEHMAVSKVCAEEAVQNYIKDLEGSVENVKPEVYEVKGKHYMMENMKCNMEKRSNMNAKCDYMNNVQSEMVRDVKAKKAMKK
jgi:Mg-chelatase subunit ChlD